MRIVIDLDGTICEIKKEGQSYADVKPLPRAIESIKRLKAMGHYIIIYTARHMKTCGGNVEEVKRRIGEITCAWLKRYEVPYDELIFGKPYGDLYIDDLAVPFNGWDAIDLTLTIKDVKK